LTERSSFRGEKEEEHIIILETESGELGGRVRKSAEKKGKGKGSRSGKKTLPRRFSITTMEWDREQSVKRSVGGELSDREGENKVRKGFSEKEGRSIRHAKKESFPRERNRWGISN